MDIYDLMKQVNDAFNQRYCFSSKRKNSKRYGFTILDNFQFVSILNRIYVTENIVEIRCFLLPKTPQFHT